MKQLLPWQSMAETLRLELLAKTKQAIDADDWNAVDRKVPDTMPQRHHAPAPCLSATTREICSTYRHVSSLVPDSTRSR
jgi:hypothetical protein